MYLPSPSPESGGLLDNELELPRGWYSEPAFRLQSPFQSQSGWAPTNDAQRCSSTVRVQRQPPNTDLSREREFSVSSRQCLLRVPDHENQLGCLLMIQILELRLRPAKLESQGGLRICILVTNSGEPCDQGSLRTCPWAPGSRGGF